VLAGDHEGEGDVPQTAGALVGDVPGRLRSVQTVAEAPAEARVALAASLQRVGVDAVEVLADVLPAGRHEHGAAGVEDGEAEVAGGGEAFAHALQAFEIDEVGQSVRGGLHASSPHVVPHVAAAPAALSPTASVPPVHACSVGPKHTPRRGCSAASRDSYRRAGTRSRAGRASSGGTCPSAAAVGAAAAQGSVNTNPCANPRSQAATTPAS